MTRAVVLAAVVGAACGVVGGVAGGWLAARDPGRGRGTDGSVRADVDRIEAELLAARTSQAEIAAALARRVESLEQGTAAAPVPDALAAAVRSLGDDLRSLRDAMARDLRAADTRLAELERRADELSALAALASPGAARAAASGEEEEATWVNLASDPDPLRRFSALAMLGRARTDRSVRASVESLRDPAEIVVWQAARNLGAFGERGAAPELAALLGSESVALRHAAHEALRRLGAPDPGFDATALPEARRAAAEALAAWAREAAE